MPKGMPNNKKTAWNWIAHNVEETGRTEDVLPILYAKYAKQNMETKSTVVQAEF